MRLILLIVSMLTVNGSLCAQLTLEAGFPNLFFTRPVDIQNSDDGSNRLFVVEQPGIIRVFENNPGVTQSTVFLDIRPRVDNSSNEEGLLGLAFHPDYPDSAYFYVNYTASNPNRTVISRYRVSAADSNVADSGSERVIMTIDKPFPNHNAGVLAFGPDDGYLYFSTGDGGSGGDPQNNGQNRATLLGSILRIDVDHGENGKDYAIPPDNPFVGNSNGYREEIYAYGLRNTWRMSFDPATGQLWAADVGQNQIEEIDIVQKGGNYGWRIMEGDNCYQSTNCNTAGLILPVWQYPRSLGQSITGGYVYRGSEIPELVGKYIYADYASGRIWSLAYDGPAQVENVELFNTNLRISSFGTDEDGELYLSAFDGQVYRFRFNPNGIDPDDSLPADFELEPNYPNPFNPATTIPVRLTRPGDIRLDIFDVNGRWLRNIYSGTMPAGTHRFFWNGRDNIGRPSASGHYFYRLAVDGAYIKTRQMTLLR